jgi:predicted CoA-binding protein
MSSPTVAIIGASADPTRFSHQAIQAHRRAGYTVFPVHPRLSTIDGLKVHASVRDIPVPLDRVSLYVPAAVGLTLLEDIAARGCRELWVNPGAESPELLERARQLGLNPICGCSLMDARARRR